MKWMISEDKLGSDQREVIDEIARISDRPIWIKGYAGSGKSVLLLHALKDYLARNPKANVCVVVFTWALVDLIQTGLAQIPFLKGRQPINVFTIYQLKSRTDKGTRFDAIFCDEVQDLPVSFVKQFKEHCIHLVFAGDSAQSIYNSIPKYDLPPAKEAELIQTFSPIEKELKVIYRLTNSVITILRNVYANILGERPGIGKIDTDIKLLGASSFSEEIRYCWEDAKETKSLRDGDAIAILLYGHKPIFQFVNMVLEIEKLPTVKLAPDGTPPGYEVINKYLDSNGVPLMYVGNGHGLLAKADKENKIIIMTYHSAKGLDFDYVYLPMVGTEMRLHSNVPANALLLVALSRSKSGLTITYSGGLSSYYRPFLSTISSRSIADAQDTLEDSEF